ncbi:MAG: hypothetical protein ACJAZO_004374 [Myxococcota bacterium]|jgi:hypothetical protein
MNRLATLTVVLVGCAVEESASGPQLLIPEDIAVDWDQSLNDVDDGLVALVPVDVMVYDSQSGEPLDDVMVELSGTAPDTLLLSAFDVQPGYLYDGTSAAEGDLSWDVWRDRYVDLGSVDVGDRLTVRTDATGLARVYVLVDRFAMDRSGRAVPATVTVTTRDSEQSLVLHPR